MWCDNCLLVLPLRAGAIAWNAVIVLYSVAGGVFLFIRGDYFFLTYPEAQIYGGISMAVAAVAGLNCLSLSNKSYIWTRVLKLLWPLIVILSCIRAIIMIVELNRYQADIAWECANGGQIWTANATSTVASGDMPAGFCTAGFHSMWYAFIFGLLIDIIFEIYAMFLNWRFSKRLEHYSAMKGPFAGGYYNEY